MIEKDTKGCFFSFVLNLNLIFFFFKEDHLISSLSPLMRLELKTLVIRRQCSYHLNKAFSSWSLNFNYFHYLKFLICLFFYNLCMITRCLVLNENKLNILTFILTTKRQIGILILSLIKWQSIFLLLFFYLSIFFVIWVFNY